FLLDTQADRTRKLNCNSALTLLTHSLLTQSLNHENIAAKKKNFRLTASGYRKSFLQNDFRCIFFCFLQIADINIAALLFLFQELHCAPQKRQTSSIIL